jgi:hypothetical protein
MEMMASGLVYATLLALGAWAGVGPEQNGPALRGKVQDQSSAPLPKAIVTLISLERILQTGVSSNGSFEFGEIPEGAFEIEIAAPGFAKQRFSIDRTEAAIPPLEIALHPGSIPDTETCGPHSLVAYGPVLESSHRLSGSIRSYGRNKPVANADVTLRRAGEGDPVFRTTSDKDGKYVFKDVPAARYELRISRRGYAPDVRQLMVPRSNDVFVQTTILGGNKLVICQ